MKINNEFITLRSLIDSEEEYKRIHKWCQNKDVYEWFEQRILSYDEVVNKYKNKLYNSEQTVLIIEYQGIPIGLLQFYKYDNKMILDDIKRYNNIYEYDLFIGENLYSKGIGKKAIDLIDNYLFNDKNSDCIILRPFSRNIRAIKCYEKCGYKEIYKYMGKDTLGNDEEMSFMIKEKK